MGSITQIVGATRRFCWLRHIEYRRAGNGGISLGGGALGLIACGGGAVGLIASGGGAMGLTAIGGGPLATSRYAAALVASYALAGDGKGRYVLSRSHQDKGGGIVLPVYAQASRGPGSRLNKCRVGVWGSRATGLPV
jgi:hypothetical protein